jgi:putative intracellular protease/amidase
MIQHRAQSRTPNVAFVLTSNAILGSTGKPTGSWYSEIAAPYYVFKDAGCRVILSSIAGGAAVIDPASRLPEWQTDATRRCNEDSRAVAELARTVRVETLDPGDVDILCTPGGFGPMWDFPSSKALRNLVESCADRHKFVATVCHGAVSLVAAKDQNGEPLVSQRTMTSVTNSEVSAFDAETFLPFLLETRLRELGARFSGGADWSDTVHRDGWLISGQNPASAGHVAEVALRAFKDIQSVPA